MAITRDLFKLVHFRTLYPHRYWLLVAIEARRVGGTHPNAMHSCYRLQTKLRKGNVFTSVCPRILSVGVVCQTQPPGQHTPRQTPPWQADTPLLPGRQTPTSPADGFCSRRYGSYWNAFLLQVFSNQSRMEPTVCCWPHEVKGLQRPCWSSLCGNQTAIHALYVKWTWMRNTGQISRTQFSFFVYRWDDTYQIIFIQKNV